MVETPPETAGTAEARGGEDVNWHDVRPGEPLPENLKPGDRVRLHAEGVFSEGALDGGDGG